MNDYGRVEDAAGVPRLDARVKDDVDRMRRHVVAGTPFVATNVTDGWLAWDEWRKGRGQEGEALDLEAFGAFFADAEVVLQSGDGAAAQGYGGGERVQRALSTFLADAASGAAEEAGSYLKDWHAMRDAERRGLPAFYQTPGWATDDWLNLLWCRGHAGVDDYRFLYLGPKGTWTPLHHDVALSNSWSANVVGEKAWWLWPPDQTPALLAADGSGEVPPDARPSRHTTGDEAARWPRLGSTRPLHVVQSSGEAIFVPSGWHHQVHNLSPLVLSVNHNWFGAACCGRVCEFVVKEHRRTRAALRHLHPRETAMQRSSLCIRLQTVRMGGDRGPGEEDADPVEPARSPESEPFAVWTARIREASEPLPTDVARWEMKCLAITRANAALNPWQLLHAALLRLKLCVEEAEAGARAADSEGVRRRNAVRAQAEAATMVVTCIREDDSWRALDVPEEVVAEEEAERRELSRIFELVRPVASDASVRVSDAVAKAVVAWGTATE